MKKPDELGYRKRQAEDRELIRRLDELALERKIKGFPARERARKRIAIADRVFSFQDMLEEIRAGTPIGEFFRDLLRKTRLAELRTGKQ